MIGIVLWQAREPFSRYLAWRELCSDAAGIGCGRLLSDDEKALASPSRPNFSEGRSGVERSSPQPDDPAWWKHAMHPPLAQRASLESDDRKAAGKARAGGGARALHRCRVEQVLRRQCDPVYLSILPVCIP